MEKTYDFKKIEKKWDKIWEENYLFRADNQSNADFFSVILPPPEITDSFPVGHVCHVGYSRILTMSDIILRRKKMQGINTVWFPGSPISTPRIKVVRLENQMGLSLNRGQKKSASKKEFSEAVTKIFIQLYKQGKIYRATPSAQWFLKTSEFAHNAANVVQNGEIAFIPEKWAAVYLNRMNNIRDWCISCQLGSGHPIPAYFCTSCNHLMLLDEPPVNCFQCGSRDIEQEPAVLTAWFTTAVCSLFGLGWQNNTDYFAWSHPASLMVIGFDFFFSWLAFMIMLGLHYSEHSPCREILVLGNICDETGQKTSKIEDNIIDPLVVIEENGADSIRFTLVVQAVPDLDIFHFSKRVNGYRAFINKIWNASRYIIMNLTGDEDFNIDAANLSDTDKWILHALNNTIVKINDFMDTYRLYDAANLLYHFFWDEYCRWYLEFSKSDIHHPDTRKTLKLTLYKLLQIMHPFIPFITEEIFQKIKETGKSFLLQTRFPAFDSDLVFNQEFVDVEVLKKVITQTRTIRAENKIHPLHRKYIYLKTDSPKERSALSRNMKYFDSLTNSTKTEIVSDFSNLAKGYKDVCLNWEILLPFADDADRLKELIRLNKDLGKIAGQVNRLEKKLSNNRFIKKTPEAEILNLKKNLQEKISQKNKIQKTIDDLS